MSIKLIIREMQHKSTGKHLFELFKDIILLGKLKPITFTKVALRIWVKMYLKINKPKKFFAKVRPYISLGTISTRPFTSISRAILVINSFATRLICLKWMMISIIYFMWMILSLIQTCYRLLSCKLVLEKLLLKLLVNKNSVI